MASTLLQKLKPVTHPVDLRGRYLGGCFKSYRLNITELPYLTMFCVLLLPKRRFMRMNGF